MLISRDMSIKDVVRITADIDGPRVVFFSGIHGNEVSGVHAVEKLLFDFFAGSRILRRGTLTLVRANEQALAAEQRYIKLNMNRLFRDEYIDTLDRNCYEFVRTQELKPLLESCDYFLDFHSAPSAQEPFLVAEPQAVGFYAELGIGQIITGWGKFSKSSIGGDAENFAGSRGALAATLESGSHFEKSAIDVSYRTAISLLQLLEMIERAGLRPAVKPTIVDMYAVVTKDSADFEYAGDATNFQFIQDGKAFAYQNGQPLIVAEDSYLLIPMKPADTRIGEEVCYLGRKVRA
jgi:succinylglutamate desuccinylase